MAGGDVKEAGGAGEGAAGGIGEEAQGGADAALSAALTSSFLTITGLLPVCASATHLFHGAHMVLRSLVVWFDGDIGCCGQQLLSRVGRLTNV